MSRKVVTSEVCRACGLKSQRYIKTNGIQRQIVFQLMSEVSGLDIIDHKNLPTSICCECSTQLQNAKKVIDRIKKGSKNAMGSANYQCSACLEQINENQVFRFDSNFNDKKIERLLLNVIRQILNIKEVPKTLFQFCAPCCELMCAFTKIKDSIIKTDRKLRKNYKISPKAKQVIEICDPVPVDIPFVCVKVEPDYYEPYDEIEIKEEDLSDEEIVICDQMPVIEVKDEPVIQEPLDEKKIFKFSEMDRQVGRQFFCYCGLTFESKKDEASHIRLNHNPKFKCNTCGRISFNKTSSDRHIRQEHKEGFFTVNLLTKVKKDDVDHFQCSICKIDFAQLENYYDHVDLPEHLEKSTFYCEELIVDPENERKPREKKEKFDRKTKRELMKIIEESVPGKSENLVKIKEENVAIETNEDIDNLIKHDPEFTVIDGQQIHCKFCNRLMKKIYYQHHKGSKFHKFFIQFPQFRPRELKRQRTLSEGALLEKTKVPCDVCNVDVVIRNYEKHIISVRHKYYMKHPNERPARRKRGPQPNIFLTEDVLTQDLDPKRSVTMYCDFCRHKFYKKHWLEAHMKRHIKSFNAVPCTYCQKRFPSEDAMARHRKDAHPSEIASYYCKDCDKSYDRYQAYTRHCSSVKHLQKKDHAKNWKLYVNRPEEHVCLVCDTKFVNRDTYQRHMYKQHMDGDKKLAKNSETHPDFIETMCRLLECQREFKTPNDLKIHYVLDHDDSVSIRAMNIRYFSCHCGKTFKTRNQFLRHVEVFHPRELYCKTCDTAFFNVSTYKFHRKYGHLDYMMCDYCGYKTQAKQYLRKHVRMHTLSYKERIVCEHCGFRTSIPSRLRNHVRRTHLGIKRKRTVRSCDLCGRSYTNFWALKDHLNHFHLGLPKVYKYECTVCKNRKFTKRYKYHAHLRTASHMKNLQEQC